MIAKAGETEKISFYTSPKNIADPIYYSLQTSEHVEEDSFEANFQTWENTSFSGSTSVDYYLYQLENSTDANHDKYKQFVKATRDYGRKAYDYFATKTVNGHEGTFGCANPNLVTNTSPKFNGYSVASEDEELFSKYGNYENSDQLQLFKNKYARTEGYNASTSDIETNLMAEARTRFQVFETLNGGDRTQIFESEPINAWEINTVYTCSPSAHGYTVNNNGQAINYNNSTFDYSAMMYINAVQEFYYDPVTKANEKLYEFTQALKKFGFEAKMLHDGKRK